MGSYLSNKPPFCMKNHDCGRKSILLHHIQVNVNLWIINPGSQFSKKKSPGNTKIKKKHNFPCFSTASVFFCKDQPIRMFFPRTGRGRSPADSFTAMAASVKLLKLISKKLCFLGWKIGAIIGKLLQKFGEETSGNFLGKFWRKF